MLTVEQIEEYLDSLEDVLFSSLSAATPDLPNVREVVNRLWLDISRYGPGIPTLPLPDVHLRDLGDFEVPPPPPPPLLPPSWLECSADWISRNPWKASGMVVGAVGAVGASLLVGYGTRVKNAKVRRPKATTDERRQVVVVLGGDTPLALPLIIDLEKKGYIVIASVATPEAVKVLEKNAHGFVRALVLDPNEPGTVPVFLRSLTSSLSRRFPITAAGDLFASPSSHPYIHSVISLLTLSSSAIHAPLEHLSLRNTYLPYLTATHLTPLQVIQALLPLLRTGPSRSHDKGKKTIIVCLPATDARVGLPFAATQAMSAAATLRGVEVLRREVNVAALTDKSESMRHIKVVVVDVGAFNVGTPSNYVPPHGVYKAMEPWSASEKLTYGPAFASISHEAVSPRRSYWTAFSSVFKGCSQYGVPRKPTDVAVFVDTLVGIVSDGRKGASLFGLGLGLGRIRNWIHGDRFSVGAGAGTYKCASYLPSLLLDTLLSLPHILISIRNALLPSQPFVAQPPVTQPSPPAPAPNIPRGPAFTITPGPAPTFTPVHAPGTIPGPTPSVVNPQAREESEPEESGNDLSEAGSEADVESNSGEGSGVESSWVSLNESLRQAQDVTTADVWLRQLNDPTQ